ncbi:P-type DNA transfer ATPase VirB11 (plasmid) [Asticcacaulis sp. DW145]|uniref:P-type DNA transfer ATPase VirB11 n=1 Tax=Asticcacaulis sp. DW145 TaxID=3095608 RepID=UPI00308E60B1|nr:P-type DNA transfer ATPase VirB11 [Asticcacaulis sp. DW145]
MAYEPNDALPRDTMVRELMKPLVDVLAIKGATEVVINAPGDVFVEVGPDWQRHTLPSLTYERLHAIAQAIATFTDQILSPERPILSAKLPGGERIQIVVPPVVEPDMLSMSIRLPSATIRTLGEYEAEGAFSDFVWARPVDYARRSGDLNPIDTSLMARLEANQLAAFLDEAVQAKKNIAIVGETGSGKTTLMKSICQSIPTEERIITIEDVRELFLPNHPNKVHLLYSKGEQGVARVTPAELIAANMRMKPDRVLLAELRGSEAFDFLKLLTTGHSGSITSFHAESCALAAERYVFMSKEHEDAESYDAASLKALVTLTIDIIIHVAANNCGEGDQRRKARSVTEVHFDPVAKLNARFGEAPLHRAGQ